MSDPAVTFDAVWKKFRKGERYDSLRDLVPAITKRFFRRVLSDELEQEEFWALKDVSFAVQPGQALGIIGPNGAGKSTALKLLTRILKPTRGHCAVHGRVGALIEVAAGFHPDLTGRENIYLQGTIMGMRRAEIDRKLDEIIEFSGIGDFIGTPVKRYSSGMNARLGFSIAAHLDPEVLLIDEVLAVGDLAFQQKAFDRLKAVVSRDIPVIVVSHNLQRVASFCTHAILLDHGTVACAGSPAECISTYVNRQTAPPILNGGESPILLKTLTLSPSEPVHSGDPVQLTITGTVVENGLQELTEIRIRVRSVQTGEIVFSASSNWYQAEPRKVGPFVLEVALQANVPAGVYLGQVSVRDSKGISEIGSVLSTPIQVIGGPVFRGTVQMNAQMHLRSES